MCSKIFLSEKRYKIHIASHRVSTEEGNGGNIQCLVCKETFSMPCDLKKHSATHEKIKPFKCTVCNKTFHLKGQLKEHNQIHDADRLKIQCKMCSKTLLTRRGYIVHMLTHRKDKSNETLANQEMLNENE